MSHCTLRIQVFVLLLLLLTGASCREHDERRVQVAAASSLRSVLPRIVADFERRHPGINVDLRFNGSQILATQIEEGADTDLYISANTVQAERISNTEIPSSIIIIAANQLVVAIDENSPWQDLASLAAAEPRIAVGTPSVPVGALTKTAFLQLPPELSRILRNGIVTEDPSARIVLSRLELGEVDAAFVYNSDVISSRGFRALLLPASVPLNNYSAVLLQNAPSIANDLLSFLLSVEAQVIFQSGGFHPAIAGVRSQ
jgi:molybdate transport system substrate-binding protein